MSGASYEDEYGKRIVRVQYVYSTCTLYSACTADGEAAIELQLQLQFYIAGSFVVCFFGSFLFVFV